jgi:hypothetical protein
LTSTAKFKFNGFKIGRNLSLRYQKLESQLKRHFKTCRLTRKAKYMGVIDINFLNLKTKHRISLAARQKHYTSNFRKV